jgi:outer membrane protein assembly factor BamB
MGIFVWNPGRLAVLLLGVLWSSSVLAGDRINWPSRSGPTLDSVVAAEDAQGLPVEWSETPAKNLAWKVALEGFGHSVPVVGAGRIWLTAATKDGRQQFIYCLDQQTGNVLHHQLLFENAEPEPLKNEINTYASPSCALEADAVYVHFGTYGTVRMNPKTFAIEWQRRDINCRHFRGPGSSPILWQDLLILTFDGVDAQFVTALNKRTGETVWKTARTTDYGDLDENGVPKLEGDLRKAYSTPAVVQVNDRWQVVSVGSRAAFSYDAETGRELWTIRHDDFNASSPPLFSNGHAILNTGSRNSNLLSVRLDQSTRGDVTTSHVVWNRDKGNSDLSAPVLVDGRIISTANNGVVTAVDVQTGTELWKGRMDGTFTASPIVANGLVYFGNEEGETWVLRAGAEFEVVAKNRLPEGMRASPSAADGMLFLRTFTHLYALAETKQ